MKDNIDMIEKYRICDDIRRVIFEYIPKEVLIWTTRENYQLYHRSLQPLLVSKRMYDSYIRNIIRNDYDFVLETIMKTHDVSMWRKKKYSFKNIKYGNYIHFLDCYTFENGAHKCRGLLFSNVYKKEYKKIYRSISWTN